MSYEDQFRGAKAPGNKKPHDLSLEGRSKLALTGVEEVESFDEREIVLRTSEGRLFIAGEELSVSRLSVEAGDVSVQGRVNELRYEEPAERRGLFGRLLR